VCGKEYEYCYSCAEYAHLAPWHNNYHDDNCRKIFNTACSYHSGKITKDELKAIYDTCDLSNKANFKASIQQLIEELYAAPAEEAICATPETEIKDEHIVFETNNEDIIASTTIPKKKRNKKIDLNSDLI
jgi:hypothetical protein